VRFRVTLSEAGAIEGEPELVAPRGQLDRRHAALARAGLRALIQSDTAGVFARLPRESYRQWNTIFVTFTPEEVLF
jgi:hypothetical protein